MTIPTRPNPACAGPRAGRKVLPIAVLGSIVAIAGLLGASGASAVEAAPGLQIKAVASPTIFSTTYNTEEAPNSYLITVTNTGSEPTVGPFKIKDELPPGLTVTSLLGELDVNEGAEYQASCNTEAVECTYEYTLPPGERMYMVVGVAVASGDKGPFTNAAIVSGGGSPSASVSLTTTAGTAAESEDAPFGLAAVGAEADGLNGQNDSQAGDHPYESSVSFSMNTYANELQTNGLGYLTSGGPLKDVVVQTPPGITGDPTAVEQCPQYLVASFACPPSSQIGWARLTIITRGFRSFLLGAATPVFNVIPSPGYSAEFVSYFTGLHLFIPLYASVTPESNYSVRLLTPDIPGIGSPTDVSFTFFGTPLTDPTPYDEYKYSVKGGPPTAFLDDPVNCSAGTQMATVSVDSWQHPGPFLPDGQPELNGPGWVTKSATMFPSLTGCELLQFNPTLTVTPETTRADEPSGTTVDIHVPQEPQQLPALVTPEFRETTVTLPSGVSLSPAAGDGLQGCTNAQIDLSVEGEGTCPNGSQIGTVTVTTPLLHEELRGGVFLGTPNCNPCSAADASDGNMFRVFLQIAGAGAVIKLEGKLHANPTTGQLTTIFKNTPELPVSDIVLHFNGGLRAGLSTPQSCGTFTSSSLVVPWSAPITPAATPVSQFTADWNGNGEACPAVWPFNPKFEAGTSNPNAGQYTPLTVTFNREDREQDFSEIKVQTPPGLLGSLATVPLCGEPPADIGTCSEASKIGELTVAAGSGSHPYYQKGNIYLTGPYKGAPFGLSIVVPTHAGPFNLGNVVVRAQINIDPNTTALTVTTEPLPQVVDGIQLRLRTTNVTINRPNFIFNPTDCALLHIVATASGSQGAQVEDSVPFAVSGCAGLPFGPKFVIATSGTTSRQGGASLDAKLTLPPGAQSNIAKVKIELPKQLPSRLSTLQKACLDKVFDANPAACPVSSEIGTVQAVTPILPVPLRGPMYFVSHGGAEFPELVAVLQGYGVRVDVVGTTFISKAGITSTTFTNVPDVPVSTFEVYLPEGPYSALAANGNLCKNALEVPTLFIAQDGAELNRNTPVGVTGCPKAKKAKKASRAGRGRAARRRRDSVHGRGH